jgi:hypothetical protein
VILSDHELAAREHEAAALHLQALDRDVLDPRVVNGDRGVYNWFRKEAYRTGATRGRVSYFKLAKALYPDVTTPEDAERKRPALWRRLRRHQAAGVIDLTEHHGRELEWQLVARRPDPDAWPDLHSYSARRYPQRAGPCSSTGTATSRRRPACRLEPREALPKAHPARRVHRWNPRIGRGSEHRYDVLPAGSRSLFSPSTFETGGSPPPRLASLGLGAGDGLKPVAPHERARPPAASSDARNAHHRDEVPLLRSPGAVVANVSRESARREAALGSGSGRPVSALAEPKCVTELGTRSDDFGWLEPDGYDEAASRRDLAWSRWADRRRTALERLAAVRWPAYADVAEAFGLVVAGGGPDAPAEWDGHRHARQATRETLEREAARYDRYAGRLAADGVGVDPPSAMAWLIGYYAAYAADAASPGVALTALTRAAKRHRRAWNARHPEIAERRRREREVRRAEQRAGFAESHLGFDFRQAPPRRRAHWQLGEDWC